LLSQGNESIRVAPTIPGAISVKPGEVATSGVRITSTAEEKIRCFSMIDLPGGWRRIIGEQGFDVLPGTEAVRLVSVAIPKDASSGSYVMSYVLRASDSGEELQRVDFKINVVSSLDLGLVVLHAPRNAVAGSPYTATFQLTNRSNETGRTGLRVRSIPDLPATIDSAVVTLYPGEIRDINVTVVTDEASGVQFRHALELQAMLLADNTIAENATALVTVLPRTTIARAGIRSPSIHFPTHGGKPHQRFAA